MTDSDYEQAQKKAVRERQRCRMLWYVPGWNHIVEALSEAVDRHERDSGTVGQWSVIAEEKFGRLRFTSSGGDTHTAGLERLAVLLSQRICQECGAPGHGRRIGQFEPKRHATLCDGCAKKLTGTS